jgi:hypothetical protein
VDTVLFVKSDFELSVWPGRNSSSSSYLTLPLDSSLLSTCHDPAPSQLSFFRPSHVRGANTTRRLSGASPDNRLQLSKVSLRSLLFPQILAADSPSQSRHHHVAEHIVLEPDRASQRPEPAGLISTNLQVKEPGPPRGADCQAEARVRGAVQGMSQASLARGAEADQALQHRGL